MKIPKQITLKTSLIGKIVGLVALLFITLLVYVFAATPSTPFYIGSGPYPGAPSYTVWKEGSNYFAKNGNGQLKYSGTNASQIILNCFNGLTASRTWKEKILLRGELEIDTEIAIPAYTILAGGKIKQEAAANIGDGGGRLLRACGSNVEIRDMIIDFNGAAQTYSGNPALTWIHAIELGNQAVTGQTAYYAVVENVIIKNAFGREKDPDITVTCIDTFNAPFAKIKNVLFDTFDTGLAITKEFANSESNFDISHVTALNGKEYSEAIYYENGQAMLNHIWINNSKPLYIEQMQDSYLNDIVITYPKSNISIGAISTVSGTINSLVVYDAGISIAHADNLRLVNLKIVNATGVDALQINSGTVELVNPHIVNAGIFGVDIQGANTFAQITGGLIERCQQHGLVIQNATLTDNPRAYVNGLEIINCSQAGSGSYSGVCVQTNNNTLWGMKIEGDNHKYGIVEQVAADYNIVALCKTAGTVYGIHTIGANTHVNLCWNGTNWIS